MHWGMFLLLLMGQCFLFVCHLYEYHFIGEQMTWEKAQNYCRTHHTDLAKVFDETDVKRLLRKAEENQTQLSDAWIGLRSFPGRGKRMWHWSLPGIEYIQSEIKGSLDNTQNATENCAVLNNDQRLENYICTDQKQFVCYDETKTDTKFHLIDYKMNWSQAQNYCRHNHTDLISGAQQLKEFKNTGDKKWIGLFRDTWRWSDQSNFSFRHWESFKDEQSDKTCATTLLNTGKWSFEKCNESKPFFCYEDKMVVIQENKTWEVALNYCRKNHIDLVTISNPPEQGWVQEKAKNASSSFVWLGLRYTCVLDLWFWVNDQLVCYDKWAPGENAIECNKAVAMKKECQHEWVSKNDSEIFNFICVKR